MYMARSETSCLFPILLFNDFLLLLFNVSYECTNIVTDYIFLFSLQFRLLFDAGQQNISTQFCKKKKKKNPTVRPSRFFFHRRAAQQH